MSLLLVVVRRLLGEAAGGLGGRRTGVGLLLPEEGLESAPLSIKRKIIMT